MPQSHPNRKSGPGGRGPTEKSIDYTRVYAEFGVVFGQPNSSDEAEADACPFCGKDRFHLNVATGQYHCKHEDEGGNLTTFLTRIHAELLEATGDDDYRRLKAKRGISIQTLKRHELAFDAEGGRWLIPFKNLKGNVVNVQFYDPLSGRKMNLPEVPSALYGLERLSSDPEKVVFLVEGAFDAIALDYHLGDNRKRYDILAQPGSFKAEWMTHLKGRKVRALYDNDAGGEAHRKRLRKLQDETGGIAELRLLRWPPEFPEGIDINDLIRDPAYRGLSVVTLSSEHSVKVERERRTIVHHGRRPKMEERPIDWVWPDHLRCGTYVSFSGKQGTFKSTIALELAARYTTGRKMPLCSEPGMPAGDVLYVYAEDDREAVENSFEGAGGDFERFHAMPAVTKDGEDLNLLDYLGEIEQDIREFGIRLVIIDGQNSVVGAPNISTDMLARVNITNKLHRFAQRVNVCLIGLRNEDAEGRALGPQSFGDIGRCVVRAVETDPPGFPPYCLLKFVKVSDRARSKYPDIPYSVRDCGGSHREILWGVARPTPRQAQPLPPGFDAGRVVPALEERRGRKGG